MPRCRYGFYTCSFIGQVSFCNKCDEGQNYQMRETKKTHGGKRKGSGRPAKPPTKTLSYRVREDKADIIHVAIKKIISSMSKN